MARAAGAGESLGADGPAAAWPVRTWRAVRWYVRGVTRADAYDRYVDHLRRTHPGAPVPSERQFWRDTYADMERNPRSRCC